MTIKKLLNLKNANVEYFKAMTEYAYYNVLKIEVIPESQRTDAEAADLQHFKNDINKYQPILLNIETYSKRVKN